MLCPRLLYMYIETYSKWRLFSDFIHSLFCRIFQVINFEKYATFKLDSLWISSFIIIPSALAYLTSFFQEPRILTIAVSYFNAHLFNFNDLLTF